MRSFVNISDKTALMMAIIGGKEPGHVIRAESIRKKMVAANT
jgi:hypothetical protein